MADGLEIRILGSFAVCRDGVAVPLSDAAARLTAYLTLNPGPWRRSYIAGQLWPDVTEKRALANLRNAMWRLSCAVDNLLVRSNEHVGLSGAVSSDLSRARALAVNLVSGTFDATELSPQSTAILKSELLPDWYEDWLLFERARLKQLFIHALEVLAKVLAAEGRWAEALDAALVAISMEPLRETAHRIVVDIHLGEGNLSEAWSQFEIYRMMLHEELGAQPSAEFAKEANVAHGATGGRSKPISRRAGLLRPTPASV